MYIFPYFIQICFHAGGCGAGVVFCREDYIFLKKFYWLDELFAFGIVLISEIVF